MNAKSILESIFNLKWQLDLASPEDCAYIQRQIDEQLEHLQSITGLPAASLNRVINKQYSDWLDGKWRRQLQISPICVLYILPRTWVMLQQCVAGDRSPKRVLVKQLGIC